MRTYFILSMLVAGSLTAVVVARACRKGSAAPSELAEAVVPTPPGPPSSRPQRLPVTVPKAGGDAGPDEDIIGSIDPTSKDYDPVILNRITDVSPMELMRKEPRDPAFAIPREAALRERIVERLRQRVSFDVKVNVSCRTSGCEVTVEGGSSSAEVDSALQAIESYSLTEVGMVGPLKGPDGSLKNGFTLITLYSAALRDHATYERQLRRHKAQDEIAPKAP